MEATMATKITVVPEDDLDSGLADETIRCGSAAPTTRST